MCNERKKVINARQVMKKFQKGLYETESLENDTYHNELLIINSRYLLNDVGDQFDFLTGDFVR